MAAITTIRFLTIAYNKSVSRGAFRALQVQRVPAISSWLAVRVPVILPLFVRPSGL
jgi:hypothetical protein